MDNIHIRCFSSSLAAVPIQIIKKWHNSTSTSTTKQRMKDILSWFRYSIVILLYVLCAHAWLHTLSIFDEPQEMLCLLEHFQVLFDFFEFCLTKRKEWWMLNVLRILRSNNNSIFRESKMWKKENPTDHEPYMSTSTNGISSIKFQVNASSKFY